ncbi:type IV secretory system conjugative DNA transfer family protein [Hyphomicrobium sp.]|uniref:type IV secretory system conjugative DNA transfer family protein n=1 Tax=Hyphomicrobium sp. TaxID=82 RepID=UPI0025BF1037|nr:type IV secretory system conjugative DNA transfer family protein [Hyphomicrobium sp.]MCC7253062.1 type IV secretory system conjugative DNA transfer family protein [Hyphomicrobium sp.]
MQGEQFNEHFRFGSAGWADEVQMRAAGLFAERGLPIGFMGRRTLWLEGDAPLITFGGAGTGKLTTVIGHVMCAAANRSGVVLDPRGEIAATFMPALTRARIEAFLWNPYRLHGLPHHACNPLAVIDPAKDTFHADCKLAAQALVNVTSKSDGKYFEQRGGSWVEAFLKFDASLRGGTSLPRLMRIVNAVESGSSEWPAILEGMVASTFPDLRRTAGEMITKQQDSPREFGSIMGEIYAGLSFLDDPALRDALGEADFSLESICGSGAPKALFLMIPAEYLQQASPVLRLFLTACMLHKTRQPDSRRLLMLIDEAAQLGPFETLQRLYTYGRGIGIQPWTFWQDVGQIARNFGPSGVSTFLASSQMRQFLGARDFDTARLIANMLGSETLEYDDKRMQDEARRQKRQAVQRAMTGEDVPSAVMEAAHFGKLERMKTKQQRKLMTEDEVLGLRGDRQVLFISGAEPLAVLAERQPYFERPEFAGLYLPNPFHPPYESVQVMGRWGKKRLRVIREPVAKEFSSFAQYRNGDWAYVEGFKPT